MDYLFYQVAAINGFDAVGHYLRAGLILNACSQYAIASSPDCLATFENDSGSSARAASATSVPGYADTRRSPSLRKLDAYFHGKTLQLGDDGKDASASTRAAGTADKGEPAATATPERARRDGAGARRPAARGGRAHRAHRAHAEPAAERPQRPGRRPVADAARLPARERRLMRRGSASHRRQPRAHRRGDDARRHRRGLPRLQRQLRPAVRPDLRAQDPGPQRGQPGQGQRRAHRRHARRRGDRHQRRHREGRVGQRAAHAQARDHRQAAAGRLDRPHPPALGARPEVRRDHQGHVEPRLRGRRDDPVAQRDAPSRSRSTSSSAPSTTRPAPRPRAT